MQAPIPERLFSLPQLPAIMPGMMKGIARARLQAGLTQQQLGDLMNVGQGTVARWEGNTRGVNAEKLRRLADVLGTTVADLMDDGPLPPQSITSPGNRIAESDREWFSAPVKALSRDLPVLGSVLAADLVIGQNGETVSIEQLELALQDVIEMVRRPLAFAANAAAYALYVSGSSMEPRYDAGDLIYVDPHRPPANGDDVVVQLVDGNGHDGDDQVACAMIKRLVRRSSSTIELEQYNPPLRFVLPTAKVTTVHRVVRTAELLGM